VEGTIAAPTDSPHDYPPAAYDRDPEKDPGEAPSDMFAEVAGCPSKLGGVRERVARAFRLSR